MNSRLGLQALPETLRLVAVGLGISILAFCGVSRSDPVNSQGELIVFSLQPADDETSPDSFGYAPDTILLQLRIDGPGSEAAELAAGWHLTGPASVSFDGKRLLFSGRSQHDNESEVWELSLAGGAPRRIGDLPCDCYDPSYLPDGKVVFSGLPKQSPTTGGFGYSLFTFSPETEVLDRITFGNSRDRVLRILADGRVLFERKRARGQGDVSVAQKMTVNPDGTGLTEFIPSGSVEYLPEPVVSRKDAAGGESILIHVDPSSSEETLLFRRSGFHALDPISLRPRPRPATATSVVDKNNASGWLLCLDSSLSREPGLGLSSQLRVARFRDGQTREVLGEAPIHADGSFYVEVPADRLLLLETLDAEGRIVAQLGSGIWVRPNEHRGCVGCHESPYLAPENRVPDAVRKPAVRIGIAPELKF